MNPRSRNYLLSRGYDEETLLKEELWDVPVGEAEILGVKVFTEVESIAAVCRSMSEQIAAVHTIGVEQKDYRTYQAPGRAYLPSIYGNQSDRDVLFRSGEMILVEGFFDRIAIKRAFPERAVFARLTKGATGQMVETLQVYCSVLWLGFDQDEYGEKAAVEGEKKLGKMGIRVHRLVFPRKDPGRLLEIEGVAGVRERLEKQFRTMGF